MVGSKGRRLEPHVTAQVRAYLEDTDLQCSQIATLMGLNKCTIERMRLSFDLFDAPYAPRVTSKGPVPLLTAAQEDVSGDARRSDLVVYSDSGASLSSRTSATGQPLILMKLRWLYGISSTLG